MKNIDEGESVREKTSSLAEILKSISKFDAEMEQIKKITGDKKFHKIWKKIKKQHQKKSDNLN